MPWSTGAVMSIRYSVICLSGVHYIHSLPGYQSLRHHDACHAGSLPMPCPGPILARTARPLLTGGLVALPRRRALFSFFPRVSFPLCLWAHQAASCVSLFGSQARLCWSTQLTTRALPHRNTLVSFAARSSEPFLPMSHHLLPQVVRLPRPLLPAGRIFPMYSRQIPLTGGHHVRSVSCPALSALPCPATSCPAGCPVACLLGRLAGRPAGLHHR